MTLTGIHNQNEFYSAHYLSDVFEGDVKETLAAWTQRAKDDENFRAPFDAIGGLRRDFFALQKELEGVKDESVVLNRERGFVADLLTALGYEYHPAILQAGDYALATCAAAQRRSGSPLLWAIEVAGVNGDGGSNPLDLELHASQYPEDVAAEQRALDRTLEELIDDVIFRMDEPPRWLLLVSADMLVLVDRSKWNEKRLLAFDLREILDRRESSTLRAMAVLLHRECVAPEEGSAVLDTLDENAHKHAYAVSEDLKYSMREAVELLGNEAVWYLRNVSKEKVFDGTLSAEQLSGECLRYIYRLLFLFFIEARPELGYAPMSSREYLTGYSLESLRDLEMLALESDDARDGSFIHQSLEHLFRLVFEGFNQGAVQMETDVLHDSFSMLPLKSHLFDPARTPVLARVRFRNHVLQHIIRLMSLSRAKGKKRPGRISYARLGINQLGAVYEGLLSYTGFFAEEDMYEVKKKGSKPTPLERAFFVTVRELAEYEEDEKVLGEDGRVRKYEKGSFIYRLTGRSRETSASYYTPEVLTQCLVKYALKELFEGKSADDILHLKVCEPAMGSAAFLNEYVNQAAETYLQRKQKELRRVIPHDRYVRAKQKVKAWIADNCAYGVDLNPVAVELAEVSLWLNTIHRESLVPWFGNQLVVGNSLIGARRHVFPLTALKKKKDEDLWLDRVPDRVPPGEDRPADTIYHFLLPDKGMAAYNDKVVRAMVPEEMKTVKSWQKSFTAPPSKEETVLLVRLSEAIDGLWDRHIDMRRRIESDTEDDIDIFGHEKEGGHREKLTLVQKDRLLAKELYGEGLQNSSPYRRLKLVMDYWCALWFWPIQDAGILPTRAQYLEDLTLILEGRQEALPVGGPQSELFPDSVDEEQQLELLERYGIVDVDELCRANPRLRIVRRIAAQNTFLHWELEFAEIFADRGGFDLILGNPPWIKIEWNEGSVLGDADPRFVVRKHSAKQLADLREETIDRLNLQQTYLDAFTASEGTQNFLNGRQNYPLLQGMQSNLYKCFLPQAWMVGNESGVSGFLHPEGVYDDPKGGKLRAALYPRLRAHFQFQNELHLFSDVHNETKFSVNILSNYFSVQFDHIANLFIPQTVDSCYEHSGAGLVPGIKSESNAWCVSGHLDRIIRVTENNQELFAQLYDPVGITSREAKLPALHASTVVSVLSRFIEHPCKLGDIFVRLMSIEMWHETNAQADGTIQRKTQFPRTIHELIFSGPHFYVANPINKTPRRVCDQNKAYDSIHLQDIPDDYLPRTNYIPACSDDEYRNRTVRVPWGERPRVTDLYRLVHRRMIGTSAERTAIPAIIPPGPGHVHTVVSTAFEDEKELLLVAAVMSTIVVDFFVKTTGRSDLYISNLHVLPIPLKDHTKQLVLSRILRLNCLTKHYADLWSRNWEPVSTEYEPISPHGHELFYSDINATWKREYALRSAYGRRWAQLEIDVALAMELGITLDELITIFRIQFPVLRQYEQDTWYDQRGNIVFTVSKGLAGVGLDRKSWEEVKDMQRGTVDMTFEDDTMPGGPVSSIITYYAPFDRCDREEDYSRMWAEIDRMVIHASETNY